MIPNPIIHSTTFGGNPIVGIDGMALTKLDVLDGFDVIKICTGYKLGDKVLDYLPAGVKEQQAVKPIYETLEGWKEFHPRRPLLARPARQRHQIHPPHRGADRRASGAGVNQPRARGRHLDARSVQGVSGASARRVSCCSEEMNHAALCNQLRAPRRSRAVVARSASTPLRNSLSRFGKFREPGALPKFPVSFTRERRLRWSSSRHARLCV